MNTAKAITDSKGNRASIVTGDNGLKTSMEMTGHGYFTRLSSKPVIFKRVTLQEAIGKDMFFLVAIRARDEGVKDMDFVEIGANNTARYLKEITPRGGWLRTWAERKHITHVNRVRV